MYHTHDSNTCVVTTPSEHDLAKKLGITHQYCDTAMDSDLASGSVQIDQPGTSRYHTAGYLRITLKPCPFLWCAGNMRLYPAKMCFCP